MAEVPGELVALPVISSVLSDTSKPAEFVTFGVVGAVVLRYRMRGFDQNVSVNDFVYWDSASVDDTAANYGGSPGPVADIVVFDVRGT